MAGRAEAAASLSAPVVAVPAGRPAWCPVCDALCRLETGMYRGGELLDVYEVCRRAGGTLFSHDDDPALT